MTENVVAFHKKLSSVEQIAKELVELGPVSAYVVAITKDNKVYMHATVSESMLTSLGALEVMKDHLLESWN